VNVSVSVFDFLIGAGRFIILLGVLIFVHELGHFFAAKLSNVYVVRLSLGWGKRLFGFKRGETDYCISRIPIGGYVKMVGQEDLPRDEEEALAAEPDLPDVPPERRFNNQPLKNRIAISVAGPLMNLLFAFPVLWLVFTIGIWIPVYAKHTRIGTVYEGSPAEAVGIRPGQRILSINGEPVHKWEDVQLTILTSEDQPLDIKLEDISGEITRITAAPSCEEGSSRSTLGIEPLIAEAVTSVFPGMPAERGGLKEGDIILSYDDNPPSNEILGKLVEVVNQSAGRSMTFIVLRDKSVQRVTLVPKEVSVIEGVAFSKNIVAYSAVGAADEGESSGDTPALQQGDVVIAVNGQPLAGEDLENYLTGSIYDYSGKEIELRIERPRGFMREPQVFETTVALARTGRIGVSFSPVVFEKYGPARAFAKSIDAFGYSFGLTMKTLYFLVSGKVSTKEMAGPIGIAVMTEKSLEMGIGYYLNLVAFITINLAIINLLPIPMLDGGMILLVLIEAIRRKPLEEKFQIMFQKVGIAFILFIILVATYNDILRTVRLFFGGEFLE